MDEAQHTLCRQVARQALELDASLCLHAEVNVDDALRAGCE